MDKQASGFDKEKQKESFVIEMERFGDGLTEPIAELEGETENFELYHGNKEKKAKIKKGLDRELKGNMVDLLREYANIFSWSPDDIPGIDELISVHKFSVDPK